MTIKPTLSDRFAEMMKAGRVWRWHANPELSGSGDRVDGHAGRVARIILMLHPAPSLGLIAAALVHDDGEIAVGDMKYTLKAARPDVADALWAIESRHADRIWGAAPFSSLDDHSSYEDGDRWLRFADRLDAYLWARDHGADMGADGWPDARAWLLEEAEALIGGPSLAPAIHARRWTGLGFAACDDFVAAE